ncbi:MAG: DUF2721 domain-containing protein [Leptospiraceae bacterium]|nr:DUF2721 domain-containing protein [Leptospiraceae bacterium]MBK7054098.1 DUF2721 domain-containing protein [Leptospiraceae bacterium]MBK9499778.1 DUF2721 domain-containing protein [Leptospiraceae bacterium]MBL0262441.1 DUF2721 domain-containing protein [Leptospiraceae bacterium]MBP9161677.1 DUF2721 domain-containing protein [Leptospiraceae bacterium]
MELTLNTPSLLFPAISLLMLAFTNRFLSLAKLIRDLYTEYSTTKEQKLLVQIQSLRHRLNLIRYMQFFGISSILLCVICMLLIFVSELSFARIIFELSLVLLAVSLSLSVWEIQISTNALSVELSDLEELRDKK